jgi:hypothetical protein
MRHEDDEINPFSREATTRQANRDVVAEATPVQPPQPRPRRNSCLLWLIPVLLFVVASLICCGGLFLFGLNKVNEPVDAAIVAMEIDESIAAKLGKPLERTSRFAVNNYEYDNGNGSAEVNFTVEGPAGSAQVNGKMKLFAGVWSPEDLTITCPDGTEFTLPAQEP